MKKYLRIAAMAMVLVMTLGFAIPVSANTAATPFRDVPASHFAFNAINWVAHPDNGSIMVPDLAGNFHPHQTITKFEAARIFAMAAGFRSAAHPLTPALQAEIDRSFVEWRPFIDELAAQNAQWSRIADREIAFLLYRNVLTTEEVEQFIGARLTRKQTVAWLVRLVGRQTHAAAVVLPFHNPFADEADIAPEYIRYVYYARDARMIAGGGDNRFNPLENLTRAHLAVMLYNTLGSANAAPLPGAATATSIVSGIVELVYRNSQVFISSPLGPQNFLIAEGATIIVDNMSRTAAFIQTGMAINAVLNAQGQIISLVARTAPTPTPTPTPTPAPATPVPPIGDMPGTRLYADEGFVVSTTANPPAITIRTQRVRITGQIVDEERVFAIAPGAVITRAGETVPLSEAHPQDIAFFRFSGNTIHELELEDRVRTIEGVLMERRLADSQGNQTIVVELASGTRYELRVTTTVEITRGALRNLGLQDLRIGDNIYITLESGIMTSLHATGMRAIIEGQLTEIRITRHFSEIMVQDRYGHNQVYTIMPGTFDVYSLRIGMDIRLFLDSWEVLDIQIIARGGLQVSAVLGNVRAIRAGQTLELVELDGTPPRTHTVVVNSSTIDTATNHPIDFNRLRVNMNVYIVLVGPHSNVAASVTILP